MISRAISVVPMDDRFWGVNQTSLLHCGSDANDPKRTNADYSFGLVQEDG
jgi:hypothetical protein